MSNTKKNKNSAKKDASSKQEKATVSTKPLTKSDKVREFLKGKTFPGCAQALDAFQVQYKENMTYPQFNSIFRTMVTAGDVTIIEEQKPFIEKGAGLVIPDEQKEEIIIYNPDQVNDMFDESILIPFKSGTIIDKLISAYNGLLPAVIKMVPGESGVGKTSVLLEYLKEIKKKNPKAKLLFVSTEMNAIHMYKYQRRIKLGGLKIDIIFLGQYEYPHDVLERILREGYDIVLLDSFQDTVDRIVEAAGMSKAVAERWLLGLMDSVRLKNNKAEKYTSFLCTQHMTKGDVYTGSTRIKHMTDSMMQLTFDDDGQPFIEYSKNRDGGTKERLYFKLSDNGVEFDTERFTKDREIKDSIGKEMNRKKESDKAFDEFVAGEKGTKGRSQGSTIGNEHVSEEA